MQKWISWPNRGVLFVGGLLALAAGPGAAGAQALAHKGWVGNGFAIDNWWKNALFYELDPLDFQDSNGDGFGDLPGVAMRLEYLQNLNVDAIVLSPFRLQAHAGAAGQAGAWEQVYGTDDDFARLAQEASRRHLRLIVDVPLDRTQTAEQTAMAARFWLGRGVAGLRLVLEPGAGALAPQERAARVRMLSHVCASYAGERLLLDDAASHAVQAQSLTLIRQGISARPIRVEEGSAANAQLGLDEGAMRLADWTVAGVRGVLLEESEASRLRLLPSDAPNLTRTPFRWKNLSDKAAREQTARQLAVLLMMGREWPLLYFGQELGMEPAASGVEPAPMQWGGDPGFSAGVPWIGPGPNAATANVLAEEADPGSLLNWYRKLSGLRHSQTALRTGSLTLLETGNPEVVAWVRRGTGDNSHATPVLVVLNLANQPLVLSLHEGLHRIGLEASSGIRPIAVSPIGTMPSFTAGAIALGAFGAYAGELRQAGLEETCTATVRRKRRGR